MCEICAEQNYVCPKCGKILDPDWEQLVPYICARKDIKNISWTCSSENFVWLLRFEGRIVKVGYGGLVKLLNETRPNATYIRFDTAIIYLCNSEEERNVFACRTMGELEGIVNRRGVVNTRYKTLTEMKWRTNIPMDVKTAVLGDPDFKIGNTGYWDISKLSEYGVC